MAIYQRFLAIIGMLVFGAFPVLALASDQFNVSLKYGMTGSEVVNLQQFLIAQGYLTNSTATGNFLSLTQQAVKDFQTAHSLPSTGYFGPMSRAVANGLAFNSGTQGTISSTISGGSIEQSSSLGAAVILSSNTKTVTWQTSNYPTGAGVDLNLIRKTSDSPAAYVLVRQVAKDTPNDGKEVIQLQNGETGSNLYIQIGCSSTYKFTNGCSINMQPLKVN